MPHLNQVPVRPAVRDAVYSAIDGERDYQDAMKGNSTRNNKDDNRDLGSLILLTDEYLGKVKSAFAGPHPIGRQQALEYLRKTVALGIVALEYYGCPAREGHDPQGAHIT